MWLVVASRAGDTHRLAHPLATMSMTSRGGRKERVKKPKSATYVPLASGRPLVMTARSGMTARGSAGRVRGSKSSPALPPTSSRRLVSSRSKPLGDLGTARSALRSSRALNRGPQTPMSPIHVPTTGRASKAGPPKKPVDLVVVRQMLQRLVEQRPSKDSDQFRTGTVCPVD